MFAVQRAGRQVFVQLLSAHDEPRIETDLPRVIACGLMECACRIRKGNLAFQSLAQHREGLQWHITKPIEIYEVRNAFVTQETVGAQPISQPEIPGHGISRLTFVPFREGDRTQSATEFEVADIVHVVASEGSLGMDLHET